MAREGSKNIDVCFESSKQAVVNQKQGSQDSNSIKTKVEPSSMHRETVTSTIREAPATSKSSSGGSGSGGSSNPASIHQKAKSIYVKKEIPEEDRIWSNSWIHLRFASPSVCVFSLENEQEKVSVSASTKLTKTSHTCVKWAQQAQPQPAQPRAVKIRQQVGQERCHTVSTSNGPLCEK